jgi:ribosome-associated translation inhibitor RaiA
MDVRTKVTNFAMSSTVASYLDERVSTIERHLGEDAAKARVEIELGQEAKHSKHGENWFAEFQVRIPGGNYARVVEHAESITAAIDAAKDEMLRKLRTSKKEHTGFIRKTGEKIKRMLRGF